MSHILCEELAPPEIVAVLTEWHTGAADIEQCVAHFIRVAHQDNFQLHLNSGGHSSPVAALMWILLARATPDEDRLTQIKADAEELAEEDLLNWDGLCLAFLFAANDLLDRFIAEIPQEYLPEIIAQFEVEQQPRIRAFFTN